MVSAGFDVSARLTWCSLSFSVLRGCGTVARRVHVMVLNLQDSNNGIEWFDWLVPFPIGRRYKEMLAITQKGMLLLFGGVYFGNTISSIVLCDPLRRLHCAEAVAPFVFFDILQSDPAKSTLYFRKLLDSFFPGMSGSKRVLHRAVELVLSCLVLMVSLRQVDARRDFCVVFSFSMRRFFSALRAAIIGICAFPKPPGSRQLGAVQKLVVGEKTKHVFEFVFLPLKSNRMFLSVSEI